MTAAQAERMDTRDLVAELLAATDDARWARKQGDRKGQALAERRISVANGELRYRRTI